MFKELDFAVAVIKRVDANSGQDLQPQTSLHKGITSG
jgi:hypothetical protein